MTQIGITPSKRRNTVKTTDGKHPTPPGSRGAGKSFTEGDRGGLHLDGRVGMCRTGLGLGLR